MVDKEEQGQEQKEEGGFSRTVKDVSDFLQGKAIPFLRERVGPAAKAAAEAGAESVREIADFVKKRSPEFAAQRNADPSRQSGPYRRVEEFDEGIKKAVTSYRTFLIFEAGVESDSADEIIQDRVGRILEEVGLKIEKGG